MVLLYLKPQGLLTSSYQPKPYTITPQATLELEATHGMGDIGEQVYPMRLACGCTISSPNLTSIFIYFYDFVFCYCFVLLLSIPHLHTFLTRAFESHPDYNV